MKQKPTFKSLLLIASIFSLFAFVFVNVHSSFGVKKQALNTEFVATQMEEEEDSGREIAVPDITVLGRLWDIAQKLIERHH